MSIPGPKPGSPKIPGSGRKAGTPNKNTQQIQDAMAAREFSVADKLMDVFENPDVPWGLRMKALELLAEFGLARPKPAESPSNTQSGPILTREEALKILNESSNR